MIHELHIGGKGCGKSAAAALALSLSPQQYLEHVEKFKKDVVEYRALKGAHDLCMTREMIRHAILVFWRVFP